MRLSSVNRKGTIQVIHIFMWHSNRFLFWVFNSKKCAQKQNFETIISLLFLALFALAGFCDNAW